ncbi:ATP-binding cassette domain-containing protein [Arhodomonas sp. SL1]|uniref:ATP-binding cassette domain-containing protein n=1 Tax=Arhodomonas sp. SL1 TaxID=3425691 RepID=UPI003F882EB7
MSPNGPVLPLSLAGITYGHGDQVLLEDVSLRIEGGGNTVLLGPNGAGKSLLMRVCHGLLAPTRGQVRYAGAPPARGHRRHLAMVFQQPVLLRRSSIANVRHALALHGVPFRHRKAHAQKALAVFQLDHLAHRPARVLSGGERQRLALARAWALSPAVVFLDEPTSALDPASTQSVEQAVTRFRADGVTVVMATHDLAQARRLADEVVFLCGGRVLEHTPAGRFFARPRTREASAFLRGDLLTGPFPRLIQPGEDQCDAQTSPP